MKLTKKIPNVTLEQQAPFRSRELDHDYPLLKEHYAWTKEKLAEELTKTKGALVYLDVHQSAVPEVPRQPGVLRLRAAGPASCCAPCTYRLLPKAARHHGLRPLTRHLVRTVARLVRSGRRWRLDFAWTNFPPRLALPRRPCSSNELTPRAAPASPWAEPSCKAGGRRGRWTPEAP